MSGVKAGYRQRLFHALHAEAAKRKMDHDALHDMCVERFKVHSMGEVTEAQLLGIYRQWTGKTLKRQARLADPEWKQDDGMVSGEEINNVAALAAEMGWGKETLGNFVARQLRGRRTIRSRKDYARVVTPLKRMVERKEQTA